MFYAFFVSVFVFNGFSIILGFTSKNLNVEEMALHPEEIHIFLDRCPSLFAFKGLR